MMCLCQNSAQGIITKMIGFILYPLSNTIKHLNKTTLLVVYYPYCKLRSIPFFRQKSQLLADKMSKTSLNY